MTTQNLVKKSFSTPEFFENMPDFFRPWNEWFGKSNHLMSLPAVNIAENKNDYQLTLAAPGMKKDDFKIDIEGNMMTISSEKEEEREEEKNKFTRKEYSYSSFSRSFTLPDEVNYEKIDASYVDGVLKLMLPKKEEAKKSAAKKITVK